MYETFYNDLLDSSLSVQHIQMNVSLDDSQYYEIFKRSVKLPLPDTVIKQIGSFLKRCTSVILSNFNNKTDLKHITSTLDLKGFCEILMYYSRKNDLPFLFVQDTNIICGRFDMVRPNKIISIDKYKNFQMNLKTKFKKQHHLHINSVLHTVLQKWCYKAHNDFSKFDLNANQALKELIQLCNKNKRIYNKLEFITIALKHMRLRSQEIFFLIDVNDMNKNLLNRIECFKDNDALAVYDKNEEILINLRYKMKLKMQYKLKFDNVVLEFNNIITLRDKFINITFHKMAYKFVMLELNCLYSKNSKIVLKISVRRKKRKRKQRRYKLFKITSSNKLLIKHKMHKQIMYWLYYNFRS